MIIKIEIPENIVRCLEDCELSKTESINVITSYINNIMNDDYSQFQINFEQWLEDLDEQEFEEIKLGDL